ncbi:hypothetical protein CLCR_10105 [Cladophialophora carrionii]|uniref:Uncharacterized protein n=1 Tax=Cladophialophora carrionii TaxID=86049 RepID=A0A1C1CZA1_9EURO|nr:hypothetical protein CLCR_10105 [Cladophialophora carrionii]
MTAVDRPWPLDGDSSIPNDKPNLKPNYFEMQPGSTRKNAFDQTLYNIVVLRLPSTASEDDLDDQLSSEAQNLGILSFQPAANVDGIRSSLSTITIASDSVNQSPARSQSTASTSCASGEHQHVTRSACISDRSPSTTDTHSPETRKVGKRGSPLSRGFRKMAGFRKKRAGGLTSSSTLTSISSDGESHDSETISVDIRSPSSAKSSKSSWSPPAFAVRPSHDPLPFIDIDSLKRSMECKELLELRMAQLEEKARFLEFQTSLVSQLRSQREALKSLKKAEHQRLLAEQTAKNERAAEELEARQLEEEMKMEAEHDLEKRAVMLRLRHMEAYCQNPTPPPTPVELLAGRASTDSVLPERKVTEKDYHNLAQQYRERDIMDTLHTSKINVLRGKQKKAVERFLEKKEKELECMEREQKKELALIDRDFTSQETDLRLALDTKRARLESRWRTQALIACTKAETSTGLKHAPLADVVAIEDVGASSRRV